MPSAAITPSPAAGILADLGDDPDEMRPQRVRLDPEPEPTEDRGVVIADDALRIAEHAKKISQPNS